MDTFLNILDGLAIEQWEIMLFGLLLGVYILMGLFKSVLIITFGFTFYWGFKNFALLSESISEGTLIVYALSGLAVVGLLSLNYLMKERV